MILIGEKKYIDAGWPENELPEGYAYIGDVRPEEEFNTGLAGMKMYARAGKEDMEDFYLYQECGTPISEDTIDTAKRQWAYIQWVLLED